MLATALWGLWEAGSDFWALVPRFDILGVLGIWLFFRLIAWGQCSYYGWQTGRDVRYAAFIGCMVKVPTGWIPRNEIRVIQ